MEISWKAVLIGAVIGAAAGWMHCRVLSIGGVSGVLNRVKGGTSR